MEDDSTIVTATSENLTTNWADLATNASFAEQIPPVCHQTSGEDEIFTPAAVIVIVLAIVFVFIGGIVLYR